jgi:hypothetical protein
VRPLTHNFVLDTLETIPDNCTLTAINCTEAGQNAGKFAMKFDAPAKAESTTTRRVDASEAAHTHDVPLNKHWSNA